MKKSTFLFSLLLSVTTLGLHAQKPESGTYTISNVSYSEVTLADNQFLGIGAKNDDGTYQTYSMKMSQSGTTTVFDVYAKLDELMNSLKANVQAQIKTGGDEIKMLTAPDIATMLQLLTEGYSKINVEPSNSTDGNGNPIVRFKVEVPTVPNFVDNAFMTVMGIDGTRYYQLNKVCIWEYALNSLAQEYANDPIGSYIVQTVKTSLYPLTYWAVWNNNNSQIAKSRNYYLFVNDGGNISFIREEYVNNNNYNSTLWTLKGSSEKENVVSGDYFIKNVGNGKYINYDGTSVTAQPDLNAINISNKDNATTSLGVGRLRSDNVYQIDNFSVNGKSVFDYIVNTLSPDDTTIKDYTKKDVKTRKPFFYAGRMRIFYDESQPYGEMFSSNFGYIRDYETVMIAEWYIRKYGKLKMQDNGDGTVLFYFDVPTMPYTSTFLETFAGSASLWEILKSSALLEIGDDAEHQYSAEQLEKINPGNRYYIIANDDNEFDFIPAAQLATVGNKAKWMLQPQEEQPLLSGYYRIENATTANIIEFHGKDASTVSPTSDAENALSNPATIIDVKIDDSGSTPVISGMRSQGVDIIAPLHLLLTKLANKAGLETVPRFELKPVALEDGETGYIGYFDVPEMTHQQYLAVLAFVYNDVQNPAATDLFLSNVEPGKRYSVAQDGDNLSLIAVEGDEPTEYNVWKLKEVDNVNEKYAVNIAQKVQSTEEDITYYYSTLNTDFAFQIPEDGDIVGVYTVPTVHNGIAHPSKIGGPGLVIPANTPVIIESLSTGTDNNQLYVVTSTDDTSFDDNLLIGTLFAEPVEANGRSRANIRVFNISSKGVVGFYKYTGEMLVANKAYLDLSTVTETLVNTYTISFEEMGPTAIGNIDFEQSNGSDEIYDIQGRKVNKPTKGLYIINGKKVLVR
ncbi:MAG: hypothetical protein IKH26_13565 [Bacteroidaceae bacterium]|nr:hypothetical protein [Bacteroidaceae bacterium]